MANFFIDNKRNVLFVDSILYAMHWLLDIDFVIVLCNTTYNNNLMWDVCR